MLGDVNRPAPNSGGWGATMRHPMVHEVFGHGVPALFDEYVATGASGGYLNVQLMSGGNLANAIPLSAGCGQWCGGTQPVSWLVGQMSGDRDSVCWSMTTPLGCERPGGLAVCRWIGELPAIPYWGSYKCIPASASRYDIGVNCSAFGNHGCYPLAPKGTSGGAIMDVLQPSGSIMQSGHTSPGVPGFTSHIENYLKDILDCVFPVSACQAPAARCTNLIAQYGTPGSGYKAFLQNARACENGFIRRR
jgi:hypothetical protein